MSQTEDPGTNLLHRGQMLPNSMKLPSNGYQSESFQNVLSSSNLKFRDLQQYRAISGIFTPNIGDNPFRSIDHRNGRLSNFNSSPSFETNLNYSPTFNTRLTPEYMKRNITKTTSDVNIKPNIFLRHQTTRRDSSLSPIRLINAASNIEQQADKQKSYFSSVGNLTPSNSCSRSSSRSSSIISSTEERMQLLNKSRQISISANSASIVESHLNFTDKSFGKFKTRFQLRNHVDAVSRKNEDGVLTSLNFSENYTYDFRPHEKLKTKSIFNDKNSTTETKTECREKDSKPTIFQERKEKSDNFAKDVITVQKIGTHQESVNSKCTSNKSDSDQNTNCCKQFSEYTDTCDDTVSFDDDIQKEKDTINHNSHMEGDTISNNSYVEGDTINNNFHGEGDTINNDSRKKETTNDTCEDKNIHDKTNCDPAANSDESDEIIGEDECNHDSDLSTDISSTTYSTDSSDDFSDSSATVEKNDVVNPSGDSSPMKSNSPVNAGKETQPAIKVFPSPILPVLPLVTFSSNLPPPPQGTMSPFIYSLFDNVPPVLQFVDEGEKVQKLPSDLRAYLKWRTSSITPLVIRQSLARSHFRSSKLSCCTDDLDSLETHDWIVYFGRHMKLPTFKTIRDYQKVNHFPCSFQIGRKDRMWRNLHRMQTLFGSEEFSFFPQTFCLPSDLKLMKRAWDDGGHKLKWIIKPPAAARGSGIKVINKWNQIPKKRAVILQKYISEPYLINESKFDLRLYVYVTSLEPLKIYLHEEGLVRFASQKYNHSAKYLNNRFIHLTNYSINKLNNNYTDNTDKDACKGHKWSLNALWSYLEKQSIDTDLIWDNIKDIIIKTIISGESHLFSAMKQMCKSKYSVHELFGFDILLDKNLSPWILEVNISPSLHSNSPLDIKVKGSMVKDMLNLAGFQLPDPEDILAPLKDREMKWSSYHPSSDLIMDRRLRNYNLNGEDKRKHVEFNHTGHRNFSLKILDDLTPSDVRNLIDFIDEQERAGRFELIFPTVDSEVYFKYFEQPRYYNYLVVAYLKKFERNSKKGIQMIKDLCRRKYHLKVGDSSD